MDKKNFLILLKYFNNNCYHNNNNISVINDINYYIKQINQTTNNVIFLSTNNPNKFISVFFASILTKSSIFLLNPHWQKRELEQVYQIVKPNLVFTDSDNHNNHKQFLLLLKRVKDGNILTTNEDIENHCYPSERIMIPTGGTSGKVKFAIHTWLTLTNSAMGFYEFWQEEKINSFCCLPLYHVSGLMQIIRTFMTKGTLEIYDYSLLKKEVPLNNYQDFFISLVPTQLKFFLENNPNWLIPFKTVLVGGNSTPQDLQNLCHNYQINLALTYGMTETASGVTILSPDNFLNGKKSSGKVLPHAEINIEKKEEQTGKITIKSTSLFKGYYPHSQDYSYFETDDLGYLDQENYLHIVGRNSRKIISGGENIYPSEIEELIRETGLVKDIVILGKKDSYWGQVICALYVPMSENIIDSIKNKLRSHISHYKIPKVWYEMDSIPRNAQGKIDYCYLTTIISEKSN
ncbi:AMP-binding protein [Cyanobacterium sp. HL-69]|uniref:AMP-binding protein n=1 Tax=Cyanobacterium sp. HL-69 TaxID=2054282 RepID=UPI00406BA38F